tara:strand:+ start:119 stop:301 length:183 start_codon:yes stop_codon:yes gene_type:complete
MHIKRIILKSKLYLSTLFVRKLSQKEDIIYQLNDPEFKKLPKEEQAKQVQLDWKRFMEEN